MSKYEYDNCTKSLYDENCMIPINKVEKVLGDNRFYDYIDKNQDIKLKLINDNSFYLTKEMIDEFYSK